MEQSRTYRYRRNITRTKSNEENQKKEFFLFRVYISLIIILAVFCITKIESEITNSMTEAISQALDVEISVETIKNLSENFLKDGINIINLNKQHDESVVPESSIPDSEMTQPFNEKTDSNSDTKN